MESKSSKSNPSKTTKTTKTIKSKNTISKTIDRSKILSKINEMTSIPKSLISAITRSESDSDDIPRDLNTPYIVDDNGMVEDHDRYDNWMNNEINVDPDNFPSEYANISGRSLKRSNKIDMDMNIKDRNKYDRFIGRAKRDEYQNMQAELEDFKIPISMEVTMDTVDISKYKPNPIYHNDVDYPLFSTGFHHWIHATKNKTEVFDQFKGKKKVYHVLNGYERYVDDYNESIGNVSKKFFELDKKPDILSRAFYKMWEILYYYDLIDTTSKNFASAHLAEGPGSFIQATMFFREMYCKDYKSDKYHAITIHGENEDHSLDIENKFINHYNSEKPQRVFIHKTYDKQTAGGSKTKDDGDLTKTKTILNFKKEINGKVDLVTADGGFEWSNENIQEQESALLVFSEILTALNVQKKGGSFVLKMFEMFTRLSAKFIIILKHFYEKVYIVKPLTSRESNSERYVICKEFKYDEKNIDTVLKQLLDSLDNSNSEKSFMFDIYPDMTIPNDLKSIINATNVEISNRQFKVINKMITYIEGSNYFGDVYNRYRNRQIDLSKYWIDAFMTDNKDYQKGRTKAIKMLELGDRSINKISTHFKHVLTHDSTITSVKDSNKDSKEVSKEVKDSSKQSVKSNVKDKDKSKETKDETKDKSKQSRVVKTKTSKTTKTTKTNKTKKSK